MTMHYVELIESDDCSIALPFALVAMELYTFYFGVLALVSIGLAYHHHTADQDETKESLSLPAGDGKAAARKFKLEYFGVYGLVVAADWLQVCSSPIQIVCSS